MKIVICFFLILGVELFSSQTLFETDYKVIHRLDSLVQKPAILYFYTDWCKVCSIEKFEIEKDKKLVQLLKSKVYFIPFEAEKTKENILWKNKLFQYQINGKSGIHDWFLYWSITQDKNVFPLWVILDKNKNLLYRQEGKMSMEVLTQILLSLP